MRSGGGGGGGSSSRPVCRGPTASGDADLQAASGPAAQPCGCAALAPGRDAASGAPHGDVTPSDEPCCRLGVVGRQGGAAHGSPGGAAGQGWDREAGRMYV